MPLPFIIAATIVGSVAYKVYRGFIEDVETPAKESGYARASKKYEPIIAKLQDNIKYEKNGKLETEEDYTKRITELDNHLNELEKEDNLLTKKLNESDIVGIDITWASLASGVSANTGLSSIGIGALSATTFAGIPLFPVCGVLGLFSLFENHRSNKIKKSELEGYIKAKEKFLKVIQPLSENMGKMCKKAGQEEKMYSALYNKAVLENVELETRVLEKRLLLNICTIRGGK